MVDNRDSWEIEQLWNRFHEVVNMTSRELVDWLGVEPDTTATPGPPEPAPLGMGVLSILRKRRTDLTTDDVEVMQRVIDLVDEETDGRTQDEIAADERARHRLLNVGHDARRGDLTT